MFGDIKIERNKFYHNKISAPLRDVDNDHKVKPLNIVLRKSCASVKRFDGKTKWMYF